MAKKIRLKIDMLKYKKPTQEELDAAKRYVVRRSDTANTLHDIAEDQITEAAVELTQIAYRYDIDPQRFAFDSSVNEEMMDEVVRVMNSLEDSLLERLEHYATMPARDEGTKYLILAFVLALGHRNLGMRETVHQYLWRTLRQVEALVVTAKVAGMTSAKAVSLVRSSLSDFRGSKNYRAIMQYRHLYEAQYVRNGGQATFSDGSPNVQGVPVSGIQAVLNTLSAAVDAAWLYNQQLEMVEDGAIGYWQVRGSDYPCDACDEEVGFHEIERGTDVNTAMEYDPYVHAHCKCGRLPIYSKEQLNNIS